ncbi:MAG TPA: enoyl-CoA hydratase/isomerase family protein [Solirubrobacteraceae bacterium]
MATPAQELPVDTQPIEYEVSDHVATIWLNRPHIRNAVNWELLNQMAERVEQAATDPDVRVVLFRGRGGTFCAGADLNMLSSTHLKTSRTSLELGNLSAKTYDRIQTMDKPTVAVVEGFAVAGGFELLISTDFAIAADDAQIGDFHIRRALFGGCGPIYRLPRIMGMRKSKELMLTGKLLSGVEAASPEWNLCNLSAPAAELDDAVDAFVADLVDKSPFCMKITKNTLNRGLDADQESLIVMEQMACNVVHQSDDAKEGVAAFLEKRDPVWTGT